MQMREKVGKVAKHCVFPMICGSGRSKSRLAKAAGCGAIWPDERWKIARRCGGVEHISKSKCAKHHSRATFGSWDVEKVNAVVAPSTFRSENVQNTPFSDHFWKLRCRKSARRCGAKHISKSKCTKHTIVGPLLEVEMSKKCTPLWREAHFEVNMFKNTRGSDHFWRFRYRFAWQAQGIVHLVKSEQNVRALKHFQLQPPLHHTTLQYITLHYNYNYTFTTFSYTTLHYTTLHSITLNSHTTLLHYTTLHYTTLHYTTRHYRPLHFTTLYTLHYTPQHYNYNYTTTQLHNYTTTLHYTPLH